MPSIAFVREAETWTTANLVGALFLILVVVIIVVWAVRRSRRD